MNSKFKAISEIIVCESCGSTDYVSEVDDPFVKELYNEIKPVILCASCYFERCLDI